MFVSGSKRQTLGEIFFSRLLPQAKGKKGFVCQVTTLESSQLPRISHWHVATARRPCSSCGVTDHCAVSYGKYRARSGARGQTHTIATHVGCTRAHAERTHVYTNQDLACFVLSIIDRAIERYRTSIGHLCHQTSWKSANLPQNRSAANVPSWFSGFPSVGFRTVDVSLMGWSTKWYGG